MAYQCCTVNPRLLESTALMKAQPDNTAPAAIVSSTRDMEQHSDDEQRTSPASTEQETDG